MLFPLEFNFKCLSFCYYIFFIQLCFRQKIKAKNIARMKTSDFSDFSDFYLLTSDL